MKYVKELYDREVLIKACYAFTYKAYLHLCADDKYYWVDIMPKNDSEIAEDLEKELENELIFQQARRIVSKNTKSVREMILARALASTIVMEDDKAHIESEKSFSADTILKDWFSEHE